MTLKPTYEELEQRVRELEKKVSEGEALQKSHDELERLVSERTKELEANKQRLAELNTEMKVLLKSLVGKEDGQIER